jgi:chromosome segregation ATPase
MDIKLKAVLVTMVLCGEGLIASKAADSFSVDAIPGLQMPEVLPEAFAELPEESFFRRLFEKLSPEYKALALKNNEAISAALYGLSTGAERDRAAVVRDGLAILRQVNRQIYTIREYEERLQAANQEIAELQARIDELRGINDRQAGCFANRVAGILEDATDKLKTQVDGYVRDLDARSDDAKAAALQHQDTVKDLNDQIKNLRQAIDSSEKLSTQRQANIDSLRLQVKKMGNAYRRLRGGIEEVIAEHPNLVPEEAQGVMDAICQLYNDERKIDQTPQAQEGGCGKKKH